MAKKIYLLGGGKYEESLYVDVEKGALASSENKIIFELDFAREGDHVVEKKKRDTNYFRNEIGAEEINFASDFGSSEEIKEKMEKAGLLLIVGGDTDLLLEKIREKDLESSIKSFRGVIVGSSAGAYACCESYAKIRDHGNKVIDSLGLVGICSKAHYRDGFDRALFDLSREREIYGISESAAVICEDGKLNFVGDVYLFSKGEKSKVN